MIDTHVHFWNYNRDAFPWIADQQTALTQNRLPQDLATLTTDLITGVIAVQARSTLAENAFLLQLAAQYPMIKAVIGWFDFDSAIEPQLEMAANQPLLKGYRHLIQDEPAPARYLTHHPGLQQGVPAMQRQGYVYEILAHQIDLPAVVDFCQRHDTGWLVVDHLCKPLFKHPTAFEYWQKHMRELARLPHVAMKMSGLVTEAGPQASPLDLQPYVDTVWSLFGAARLLWGSDWPVSSATHSYAGLLDYWKENTRQWSQADIDQVQLATPKKIYQL